MKTAMAAAVAAVGLMVSVACGGAPASEAEFGVNQQLAPGASTPVHFCGTAFAGAGSREASGRTARAAIAERVRAIAMRAVALFMLG